MYCPFVGVAHISYEKASWFLKDGIWGRWLGLDVLAVPLELSDVSGFSADDMPLSGLAVPWLSVCG